MSKSKSRSKPSSESGQNRTPQRARVRKRWQKAFLEELRLTGIVASACMLAGVGRSTVYERRESDAAFKQAWDDAIEESADWLEKEARRRAEEGTLKPVYFKGELVGFIREYSDSLMALLLQANRPEKFRKNVDLTTGGDKLPSPVVYLPEVQDET